MPLRMAPALSAASLAVFAALIERIAGSAVIADPTEFAFHEFIQVHGRPYAHGSSEHSERLALFRTRLADVEAHNADPSRSWTAGVNHFADRTAAELSAVLGYRPGRRGGGAEEGLAQTAVLVDLGETLAVVDWRNLSIASTIPDQAACGSCWAFATASVLDAHHEIYVAAGKRFSAQELVSCVKNPHHCGGSGGCDGATVELGMAYALESGLTTLDETPYQGKDLPCGSGGAAAQMDVLLDESGVGRSGGTGGHAFGLVGWEKLLVNRELPLKQALVERGPVAVSVAASGWFSYHHGIYGKEAGECTPVVDHAVTLYGYGGQASTRHWLIRNSWGKGWGELGFIRLHRSEDEEGACGWDTDPKKGVACDGGPERVRVCGTCGILYDSVVPRFDKAMVQAKLHVQHVPADAPQAGGQDNHIMPVLQEVAAAPEGERRAVQRHAQPSPLMRRQV